MRIVFFNIGWMNYYKGISKNDPKPRYGGAYNQENTGYEVYNFSGVGGYMYGHVGVGSLNITRIGAQIKDESISDVLVVWVAKSKSFGSVVIGWYKNATVYKKQMELPGRRIDNNVALYFVKARVNDCVLLETDKRVLKVPRGKGGMGQKNVWYGGDHSSDFFKELNLLITQDTAVSASTHIGTTVPRQSDTFKRIQVEQCAIQMTKDFYEKSGYTVNSTERDYVGWDLEATRANIVLKIEVKGLSGNDIIFELTPNEFEKMGGNKPLYRICVVNNALTTNAKLHIFLHNPFSDCWENEEGKVLKIKKIISARMELIK